MFSKFFHFYKKKLIQLLFYLKLPISFLYNNDYENNFLIIICSYNNSEYVIDNLRSIKNQTYKNYKILYIDDYSDDLTYKIAKKQLSRLFDKDQYRLIKNLERIGSLKSKYLNIHKHAKDNDILIILDGDDFFYTKFALTYINYIYKTKKVLCTYGSYINLSGKINFQKKYSSDIIEKKIFRKFFHPSHLRTYYSHVFKKIPKEQFLDSNNNFFMTCEDKATMFPIMELVGHKHYFINYFLYCYNDLNPINISNLKKLSRSKKINDYEIRNKSVIFY